MMVNFQRRRLVDSSMYVQCGCMAKDEVHTLWDCVQVCEGCAPAFAEVRRKRQNFQSMSELVRFIKVEGKSLELFEMIVWLIWMQRNKVRLNDNPQPCSRVAHFALTLLAEFQQGK